VGSDSKAGRDSVHRESMAEDDEDEIELLELGEELVEKLEQIPRE
jgi:hypothetical protein